MTLSDWMGDLLADLEEGQEPDLPALETAARELRERAEKHSEYYAEEAPPQGEPVRAQMAEMAELLAEAAEFIGAYVKTRRGHAEVAESLALIEGLSR